MKELNKKSKKVYRLKYSNPQHEVLQRSLNFKDLKKYINLLQQILICKKQHQKLFLRNKRGMVLFFLYTKEDIE